MANIKKIFSLPAKVEIKALHYAHNVSMFFLLLPLLGSETSGSKKGPILSLYDKGFKAVARGFAKFQVGQMKVLKKVGLLNDDEFIGTMLRDYLHETHAKDATAEQRIDNLIHMNKTGFLSDTNAAKFIGEEGHSSELSFGYNPETKSFTVYGEQSEDEAKGKTWDKMIAWASKKSEKVAGLKGEAQKAFASAIVSVLQQAPIGANEDEVIAISPRMSERNRLMVIFKQAVDTQGQPLVANEVEADFLPAMVGNLKNNSDLAYLKKQNPEHDMVRDIEGFTAYLETYAAKKPAAPKVA